MLAINFIFILRKSVDYTLNLFFKSTHELSQWTLWLSHIPTARLGWRWCLQVHIAIQTTTISTTTPSTVPSTTYISWFSTTSSTVNEAVVPAAWVGGASLCGVDHTWRRSWDRSKSLSLSDSLLSIHTVYLFNNNNKKAVLPQGNRAMLQLLLFSV